MPGSDYNILFLLLCLPFFYILNKWIFPPFYCWLNTKLDYTVYYKDKDPFDPESYTTKGYALHNLIILPITFAFGFVLPVFLTKDSLAIFYIPLHL